MTCFLFGNPPLTALKGLAVSLEPGGVARADRDVAASRARMPLAQLHQSFVSLPADRIPLAYAESALAVQDIINRVGTPSLMALVADLGAGANFERSFAAWVQMSFAEFEREQMARPRGAQSIP